MRHNPTKIEPTLGMNYFPFDNKEESGRQNGLTRVYVEALELTHAICTPALDHAALKRSVKGKI
jgi:hypothetical protein